MNSNEIFLQLNRIENANPLIVKETLKQLVRCDTKIPILHEMTLSNTHRSTGYGDMLIDSDVLYATF